MTGLFCEVCGSKIMDLRFLRICQKCYRVLCSLCARRFYLASYDYFRPRWRKLSLKYTEVCSDCYEKLEREKSEEESRIEEDKEPPEPITKCELCTASDKPPDRKIFGYNPRTFYNCDRCGRLVCNGCSTASPEGHYEYNLICSQCYAALSEEDEQEREELKREELEEESVFED